MISSQENSGTKSNPYLLLREIFQEFGQSYLEEYGSQVLRSHKRVPDDVMRCGTEAMGKGYEQYCSCCHDTHVVYNCCHNKFCPKCHMIQKNKWWRSTKARLPLCSYSLVTLTVPTTLHKAFYRNQKVMYALLMRAGAEALKELTDHCLGGIPVIIARLQTWNAELDYHPHVHFIVSNGASRQGKWIEPNHPYWIPTSQVMHRTKEIFLKLLHKERADIYDYVEKYIRKERWTVDCQPLGTEQKGHIDENNVDGMELDHAANLEKLLKYISRDALAGHRIIDVDDQFVTISYEDHLGKINRKKIPGTEYIYRYMQHVLPKKFNQTRSYALAHSSKKIELNQVKQYLEWKYIESGCFMEQWVQEGDLIVQEESNKSFGRKCYHCGTKTLKSSRRFFEDYKPRKSCFSYPASYYHGSRASPDIPAITYK